MRAWDAEQEAWLAERYADEHAGALGRAFRERFGFRRTASSIYQKANEMGLLKAPRDLPDRAVRTVRWSAEPEMQAWMEANDRGQSLTVLSREFCERFGFPLARPQINLWRSANGRQTRRDHGGGRRQLPVGTERDTGRGYVVVKVAERPSVPQSKDNWRMKHVMAWERENGPLPEGYDVMFGDRDHSNMDPSNLVAVPHRMMAQLNGPRAPEWHDAESLKSAVALCELHMATVKAEGELPRECGVCGRMFSPRGPSERKKLQTCPECLAAGKKAKGVRTPKGEAACRVCGATFVKTASSQVRCPECIARAPKWSARAQKGGGDGLPG